MNENKNNTDKKDKPPAYKDENRLKELKVIQIVLNDGEKFLAKIIDAGQYCIEVMTGDNRHLIIPKHSIKYYVVVEDIPL
ncbi:MAG: hypothetical protein ACPLRZ_11555 [Thermovenabulum sp.]|uniref:hypothetical protein n=1 Tax=Thermovenabulum sp. TaxID=3100335 RepID=UPI003C7BEBE2